MTLATSWRRRVLLTKVLKQELLAPVKTHLLQINEIPWTVQKNHDQIWTNYRIIIVTTDIWMATLLPVSCDPSQLNFGEYHFAKCQNLITEFWSSSSTPKRTIVCSVLHFSFPPSFGQEHAPAPYQRKKRRYSKNSSVEEEIVYVQGLSGLIPHLIVKCSRTPCLAAALIVQKEHLCVAVEFDFSLALMPSTKSWLFAVRSIKATWINPQKTKHMWDILYIYLFFFPNMSYPIFHQFKFNTNY